MKTLIVFDSYFGNTEKIARAIAQAVGVGDAEVRKVSGVTAEDLRGVEMLFIGSPTRGFRASDGTQALLAGIPAGGLEGVRFAAFDTRIEGKEIKNPFFRWIILRGGYAAPKIANVLAKKGAQQVLEPAGFIVEDSQGPLRSGELERAAQWAGASGMR